MIACWRHFLELINLLINFDEVFSKYWPAFFIASSELLKNEFLFRIFKIQVFLHFLLYIFLSEFINVNKLNWDFNIDALGAVETYKNIITALKGCFFFCINNKNWRRCDVLLITFLVKRCSLSCWDPNFQIWCYTCDFFFQVFDVDFTRGRFRPAWNLVDS